MDTQEKVGLTLLGVSLIIACIGWYFGYIQPREQFLLAVAECTQDGGPDEWNRCATVVREGQNRS